MKLSHLAVDEAAANLLRVAAHIERPPVALAVIIPFGPVIRRTDGVWVIPLAALGPLIPQCRTTYECELTVNIRFANDRHVPTLSYTPLPSLGSQKVFTESSGLKITEDEQQGRHKPFKYITGRAVIRC